MEFTQALIERAKACQNAEELVALAKENDIELNPEEAELFLQDFEEGELIDEELDNVAGGQEGCAKPANPHEMVYWKTEEEVQYIFKEGDIVEALGACLRHHTAKCKVVSRKAKYMTGLGGGSLGWADSYWLEKEPGVRTPFIKGWYYRHNIEK